MSSSGTIPKTFSLLSIGQRGVGKTVFLAGSYAELHPNNQLDSSQPLWFDCQDSQVQENMERLLSYIARTGEYPPPTMKITNFNFSLKKHSRQGEQTVCHFRWWDIPGEVCNLDNIEFRQMVLSSNGCCVFIDADALLRQPEYRQELDQLLQQIKPIITLVSLNELKYAFALLLTKCDLLESDPLTRQNLQEGIKPLTTELDSLQLTYQTFFLNIPIVTIDEVTTLKPKEAAASLLWLVEQLNKAHNPGETNNIQRFVTRFISKGEEPQARVEGALENLVKQNKEARSVKNVFIFNLFLVSRKYILSLAALLAILGLVGVVGVFWLESEQRNSPQPGSRPAKEQPKSPG